MNQPTLEMMNGLSIPMLGLGLWQVKDEATFETMFAAAVEAGYRHFDSAQAYDNEQMLGAAVKKHQLKREEIFITTKIAVQNFGYSKSKKNFELSLQRLEMNYVDLLLLHFPVTLLRKKSWLALEEIYERGHAKSIGVSNYTIRHLEEMKKYAKVMPVVNQVELHLFLQQPELLSYCRDHNIVVEAYSPLARAASMDNPIIQKVAAKHGKTYAQIMLRWCLEQELVVLPKSATPTRVKENSDIFDFQLDAEDMQLLAGCEQNLRTCWSPVHVP